jgi:DNA (cytosine-5)-methyltransferase 1
MQYEILNLYAGIGGNRKKWDKPLKEKYGNNYHITAVEHNHEIADIYKEYFPDDTVIIGDAHEYLLKHFQEFDFIWASPPCPTHSRINTDGNHKPQYPDMKLWQEIIFLSNNWYKGKYVVENVVPYYTPLIQPTIQIDRHLFWCNFKVWKIKTEKEKSIVDQTANKPRFGFSLKGRKMKHRKAQILRNLINPEIGLHFLNRTLEIKEANNVKQKTIFDLI